MKLSAAPSPALAERLRPRQLSESSASSMLGPGMPLRLAFEVRPPHSCILWARVGVGKTTIAPSWPMRSTRSSSASARCSAA